MKTKQLILIFTALGLMLLGGYLAEAKTSGANQGYQERLENSDSQESSQPDDETQSPVQARHGYYGQAPNQAGQGYDGQASIQASFAENNQQKDAEPKAPTVASIKEFRCTIKNNDSWSVNRRNGGGSVQEFHLNLLSNQANQKEMSLILSEGSLDRYADLLVFDLATEIAKYYTTVKSQFRQYEIQKLNEEAELATSIGQFEQSPAAPAQPATGFTTATGSSSSSSAVNLMGQDAESSQPAAMNPPQANSKRVQMPLRPAFPSLSFQHQVGQDRKGHPETKLEISVSQKQVAKLKCRATPHDVTVVKARSNDVKGYGSSGQSARGSGHRIHQEDWCDSADVEGSMYLPTSSGQEQKVPVRCAFQREYSVQIQD
jgi:hypothetical protein